VAWGLGALTLAALAALVPLYVVVSSRLADPRAGILPELVEVPGAAPVRAGGSWRASVPSSLTPSFSLRAAYELMLIESVALAPSQATFITEFAFLNTSGDPFYHGASFGIEGYWWG
jgi:hypothetical protein